SILTGKKLQREYAVLVKNVEIGLCNSFIVLCGVLWEWKCLGLRGNRVGVIAIMRSLTSI
ncbi:MAG: hypothetical protein RSD74_06970, partial [Angelakisella sp.]